MSAASVALLAGLFVPNAQMTSCGARFSLSFYKRVELRISELVARESVSEKTRTGIVNANCGLDPASATADMSSAAVRGGFGSTVGMTSEGAIRCESVTEPSELFHMMTIGVFAICFPKPLSAASASRRG